MGGIGERGIAGDNVEEQEEELRDEGGQYGG